MILRLLGILDLISAAIILLAATMPHKIVWAVGVYLITKGGLFALSGDFMSFVDVSIGFYVLALSYGFAVTIVTVLILVYMAQKSVMSLV